jgi:hypothetical protein
VIDGLMSAQAGAVFDRGALEKLMTGIAPRVFLMRNVNDDAPVLFRTRWALSWLRGPLTQPEISRLMAGRRPAEPAKPSAAGAPAAKPAAKPSLPAGVQRFSSPRSQGAATSSTGPASSRRPSCTSPTSLPASTAGRATPGSRRFRTATVRRRGRKPSWFRIPKS